MCSYLFFHNEQVSAGLDEHTTLYVLQHRQPRLRASTDRELPTYSSLQHRQPRLRASTNRELPAYSSLDTPMQS